MNVRPSSPTSSEDLTSTLSSRFPLPSLKAAPVKALTGKRIRPDIIVTINAPPIHAPRPAHTSDQFTADTTLEIAGSATSDSTCPGASVRKPISSLPVRIGLNLSAPRHAAGADEALSTAPSRRGQPSAPRLRVGNYPPFRVPYHNPFPVKRTGPLHNALNPAPVPPL